MNTPNYYLIETPEGIRFTFIGVARAAGHGMVWLCAPGGSPLLECPAAYVTPSTEEETAARIVADARAARAERAPRN